MKDPLGDRMKAYEASSKSRLVPNTPVVVRVDGKAFHTFTRKIKAVRPFDAILHIEMENSVKYVMGEMQGAKIGYCQSDEASILLTDYDTHETQSWFGYNTQKVASVSASLFTAYFNNAMVRAGMVSLDNQGLLAAFDARVFNVPKEEVTNYFLWRIRDAERNSLNNIGQNELGHKKMQGKKKEEVFEALSDFGKSQWRGEQKSGSFIFPNGLIGVPDSKDFSSLNSQIEHLFLTNPE